MTLVSLAFFLVCLPAALLDFASPQWAADQNTDIQDAYKWLFQATRGGEHAAPSREAATVWLEREWSGLTEIPSDEKMWEPLCPAGEIGRLNLRPFRARGGDTEKLLDAFLASSRQYRRDEKQFSAVWAELGRRLQRKGIGQLTHSDWLSFDAEMKKKGYPAVHHSERYRKVRSPAYRIITADEYKNLTALLDQK